MFPTLFHTKALGISLDMAEIISSPLKSALVMARRWTTNAFLGLVPRARSAVNIARCGVFAFVSQVLAYREKWREGYVADGIEL
jgi:hypothetical protein